MKKNKIKKKSNKRGSVLVFTLFLLSISLFLGMSLIGSSITGRRSSISTGKSVHSFQVADSGLEYAFFKIREYKSDSGKEISTASIKDIFGDVECSSGGDGSIVHDIGLGEVRLYFYKEEVSSGGSTTDLCDDPSFTEEERNTCAAAQVESSEEKTLVECYNSEEDFSSINSIKSVGTYENISRSVESQGLEFIDI